MHDHELLVLRTASTGAAYTLRGSLGMSAGLCWPCQYLCRDLCAVHSGPVPFPGRVGILSVLARSDSLLRQEPLSAVASESVDLQQEVPSVPLCALIRHESILILWFY